MSSVKKTTVVDLPIEAHNAYIQNTQAHDRSHAIEAPHIRSHVEHTGSAIYKSEVTAVVGLDQTPSTYADFGQPPSGRVNRYYSSTMFSTEKPTQEIVKLIKTHAGDQKGMLSFAERYEALSCLLTEIRARLLAITPG